MKRIFPISEAITPSLLKKLMRVITSLKQLELAIAW